MKYEIIGNTVPAVEVMLDEGEAIYTQCGAMSWVTRDVHMATNARGGIFKGLARVFTGESLFQTTYTARADHQTVAFSSPVPGTIIPYDLTGKPDVICRRGAFLCAEPTVDTAVTFTKRFSAGLLGGEGFVLERLSGEGFAFLEIDGDTVEKTLAPGEVLRVNTGNVVAFETTVDYSVEMVKGVGNLLFGDEGMFLTTLKGPGKVYMQTMSINDFAGRIIAMIPSDDKRKKE